MRRLKFLRQKAGLTQAKLAELAGVEQGYISRIERGLQRPSFEVADRLAAALKVNPAEFFDSEGLKSEISQLIEELPPEHRKGAEAILRAYVQSLPKAS